MLKRTLVAVALSLATASAAVPAHAQFQEGLVVVTIGDVTILENFLNDTQIAALNNLGIPITVQAPIGIAANVCGVSAAILAGAAVSPAACNAQSGSQAFANLVNRQLLQQPR